MAGRKIRTEQDWEELLKRKQVTYRGGMWKRQTYDAAIIRAMRRDIYFRRKELKALLIEMGYVNKANGQPREDVWQTYGPSLILDKEDEIKDRIRELLDKERKYINEIKYQKSKIARASWNDKQKIDVNNYKSVRLEWELRDYMKYDDMVQWANQIKDFEGSNINFIKWNQGIHAIRIIPKGVGEDSYFRFFVQHDWGTDKTFRSCLCWDHIMNSPQGIRKILIEKNLISKEDGIKYKKYGCPMHSTIDILINKAHLDRKQVEERLRTRNKCMLNIFYLYQAYPENKTDKTPSTGFYVWEMSAFMNKKIISAMGKEAAIEQLSNDEILDLISVESGKMLVVQAEGDGIGKNKRDYSVDFKGKRGPITFRENHYDKSSKIIRLSEEELEVYDLADVEAGKFLSYQECINVVKSIFDKTLYQIGYEIPGDEPSENPLDDNFDQSFADRMLKRPSDNVRVPPSAKPFKPGLKSAKETQVETEWEDDGFGEIDNARSDLETEANKTLIEHRKQVVEQVKSKAKPRVEEPEEELSDDYSWLGEDDEKEKTVKENLTQPKRRKIY